MKCLSLFLSLIIFSLSQADAARNNIYKTPDQWWNGWATQDKLSNVTMEITPKGLYAQVDLTFTMEGQNMAQWSWGDYQGVLHFELPHNSFIHNSWLWLNDSTIVEAEIIDRGLAQAIYYGLVIRMTDPSLLEKTGTNQYQLSVWPLRPDFLRKVKISYSTLFNFRDDKAFVTLPTSLFCASEVKPSINTIIHSTGNYTQPQLLETSYSSLLLNSNNNTDHLTITPDKYGHSAELNLSFTTTNTTQLNFYNQGNNSGIYELLVPAEANNNPPRNLVFILDNDVNNDLYYGTSVAEMKKQLRSFLLTDCRPIDSFNIFYTNNDTVRQAFPGWMCSDPATVLAALNTIPDTITSDPGKYVALFAASTAFCATKSAPDAQCVLLSSNDLYTNSNASALIFAQIQNAIPNFTNKINIINCSVFNSQCFSQISQQSGGKLFNTRGNGYDSFINEISIDLDIRGSLKEVLHSMYEGTVYCDLTLPLTTGVLLTRQKLTTGQKYYPGQAYIESGKYYGTFQPGVATFEYLGQNSVVTRQVALPNFSMGDSMIKKGWINSYIITLEDANASSYAQQILDSSINNRVLCRSTAFLALENGDTVKIKGDPSAASPLLLGVNNVSAANNGVSVYPNPFTTNILIESPYSIEEITICDVTGRVVFSDRNVNSKTFNWHGSASDNTALSTGLYIVRIKGAGKSDTFKVNKL